MLLTKKAEGWKEARRWLQLVVGLKSGRERVQEKEERSESVQFQVGWAALATRIVSCPAVRSTNYCFPLGFSALFRSPKTRKRRNIGIRRFTKRIHTEQNAQFDAPFFCCLLLSIITAVRIIIVVYCSCLALHQGGEANWQNSRDWRHKTTRHVTPPANPHLGPSPWHLTLRTPSSMLKRLFVCLMLELNRHAVCV